MRVQTFLDLVYIVDLPQTIDNILNRRNRVLLVVMWLRVYPTYRMLSVMFGVSVAYVETETRRSLPLLYAFLSIYIRWPSMAEWREMLENWPKMNLAVLAIDGTSHGIYRQVQNQQQFYSGHRNYHCLHTQVIVDNEGMIRYAESGFLGHQNDAQTYRQVGTQDLPFAADCVLLAGKIYQNGHPILMP